MCADCMMSVCSSRCPNAPEPKAVSTCCMCGYGIFAGDKYFDGPEGYVCETCIDDMNWSGRTQRKRRIKIWI